MFCPVSEESSDDRTKSQIVSEKHGRRSGDQRGGNQYGASIAAQNFTRSSLRSGEEIRIVGDAQRLLNTFRLNDNL